MNRANMALAMRLNPQLSQAAIIEKRDIMRMACQGLSGLDQPESPSSNRRTGGEQARIYPVIMIRHICMAKASSSQNPFPHALIDSKALEPTPISGLNPQ